MLQFSIGLRPSGSVESLDMANASGLVKHLCETLESVELAEPEMFDEETGTGQVTDFTESRHEC